MELPSLNVLRLMYIQLAMSSNEKLRRITTWLKTLRQNLEDLNQCVENCEDENAARNQITDVFEPILQLLTSLIKFQRTYVAGQSGLGLRTWVVR